MSQWSDVQCQTLSDEISLDPNLLHPVGHLEREEERERERERANEREGKCFLRDGAGTAYEKFRDGWKAQMRFLSPTSSAN